LTVRTRAAATVAAVAVLVAGCGGVTTTGSSSEPSVGAVVTLNLAAAASLRAAVGALTDAYAAANPGTVFTVATDSSAALRTQIEQGAPVDVFLSADTRNAQVLADDGLALGDPVPFAANTVALIVPAENRAEISTPSDLATPGLRIIAAGEDVPLTTYADEVTSKLASREADPGAWAAAVRANVVSREDNAAAVLARIVLGEGDSAFFYATDAAAADGVTPVDIPAATNVRATYAGIVPSTTTQPDAATAFLAWVSGPEGRAVLAPLGFLDP
jgi:molybdate transport system substrate-binding protein